MPLSNIINCFLLTGVVPSNSKIAKEVPIYKNDKSDDPYNYHLISKLHGFSNFLEKLIANRLFAFLKK